MNFFSHDQLEAIAGALCGGLWIMPKPPPNRSRSWPYKGCRLPAMLPKRRPYQTGIRYG